MAIKTKPDLKALFQNGALPPQKAFEHLIDSMVVKRDDCFFGKWVAGTEYCQGDVVLYGKSLYMLDLPDVPDGCDPEEGTQNTGGNMAKSGNTTNGGSTPQEACICSTIPPDQDPDRWCPLELAVVDSDWKIVQTDKEGEAIMYSQIKGRIGMGTETPCGRLDIVDEGKGQYFFAPEQEPHPTFTMKHDHAEEGQAGHFVKYQLAGDGVQWLTSAPLGYLFKKVNLADIPGDAGDTDWSKTAIPSGAETLVLITTDEAGNPAVGIGTGSETPEATLEVLTPGEADFLVNPTQKGVPAIVIVNKKAGNNYLGAGISDQFAVFNTDASGGYCFNTGPELTSYNNAQGIGGSTTMSIRPNGNVGICTKDPKSKLEVYDEQTGYFCMSLDMINPALGMINKLGAGSSPAANYFTLGPSDRHAVLKTDARKGFVFRAGGKCHDDDHEKDVTEGTNLVEINLDGKVGIGLHPEHFLLDVDGPVRHYESYQFAPEGEALAYCDPLSDVLAKLCSLKAVRYKWKEGKVDCDDAKEKITLDVDELQKYFPQAVREDDGVRSIANSAIVGVLVQAIKELKEVVDAQNNRIRELETRRNK